ncbi:MAG: FGGY-family carbohydrate kinase [Gammaproteobacteria bacterium]|nr:FGGY-family carbohydrate kinase [Gammaproteobacteria bacterium]
MTNAIYIGIDLGTSGCRACAIDDKENILTIWSEPMAAPQINAGRVEQNPDIWWHAVTKALHNLLKTIDANKVVAIAIDGTSGTVLVTDKNGQPLSPALMYNDASCEQQARLIEKFAPTNSAAHGNSSGLAKILYLKTQHTEAQHALHQADWIMGKLCDNFKISDENNALKSGYDPVIGNWPEWINPLDLDRALLPEIVPPGTIVGTITNTMAEKFNLPANCKIVSGTTDSIAAFIATGVNKTGEAVTSLGSTLVLKIISDQPVFSPAHGIYSHRLGHHWLIGGASNCGGAVLKQFFSQDQLNEMTTRLDPATATGLHYYPLSKTGERFPENDPDKQAVLSPRPDDDAVFFQAILENIADIEHQGYKKLCELGAPYPVSIHTAGGGSLNTAWTEIRKIKTGVPVFSAQQTEACYGSALLAKRGITH